MMLPVKTRQAEIIITPVPGEGRREGGAEGGERRRDRRRDSFVLRRRLFMKPLSSRNQRNENSAYRRRD